MVKPVTLSRALMGSPFTITIYPSSNTPPALADRGAEHLTMMAGAAFAEIARVEDLLTDFRDSPLNRVNDGAGLGPVPVPRELFDLVACSLRVSAESGGAFDISYAAVGMLWRRAFAAGVPPAEEEIEAARRLVDYRRIRLDPQACTVHLPEKGMRIGLGSIGKAYGVDRAWRLLRGLGISDFFINGAGDIRVHASARAPRPWRIGIRDPFRTDGVPLGVISLAKGAVVTSGDYERYMEHEGRRYHHIIDARTARIRSDVSGVTVIAPDAVSANAAATAVMALGVDDGTAFLTQRSGTAGLIVASNGTVVPCNLPRHQFSQGGIINGSR